MRDLVKSNGNGTTFPSLPSFFDDFFTRDWFGSRLTDWWMPGATLPAVNVVENDNDFVIEVAAPGMNRKDFKVELDDDLLTISSEREDKKEETDDHGRYTRKEFSYQSFRRSFRLPEGRVLGDKVSARYQNGILYVTVPKSEEAKAKPVRQIAVA